MADLGYDPKLDGDAGKLGKGRKSRKTAENLATIAEFDGNLAEKLDEDARKKLAVLQAVEALENSTLQIEYLATRFCGTGSGEAAMTKNATALADLRALGDGWEEIATAPKDGESVMGLHGYGPIEMSFLDKSYGRETGWYR